jgi:uncharacterized membrane protein
VLALVALSVKEDQALFIAIAAAVAAVAYRADAARVRVALCVGVIAAAVLVVYFFEIQPHAASLDKLRMTGWAPTRFYAWSAADWKALFPSGILQRAGFFVLAFLPLLFIPLRSPAMLVAIAPLGEVLASRMSTTYTMGSHYAGAWAGWVLYAFAVAIGAGARRALYWCIALCVLEFAVANPLHPGTFLHARAARDVALDRFLTSLPHNASIATQEEAYTHLAASNPNATLLPETPDARVTACYILVDIDYPNSARLQEAKPLVQRLYDTGHYALIDQLRGISLYRKYSGCR